MVRYCPEILSGWLVPLVFCTPDSGVPTIQVGSAAAHSTVAALAGPQSWAAALGTSCR